MAIAKLDFKSKRFLYDYKKNSILKNIIKSYGNIPDVAIGFPGSLRTKSGTKYPNGTSVIDVAIWNHTGTDTIPSRPFLTSSRASMIRATAHLRRKLIQEMNANNVSGNQAVNQMGAVCASIVQKAITEWSDPPNAESTQKRKRGQNNPLVDTGLMRRSVTWEIREKK